jgi:biopolymer transport protein ExbD
MRIRHAELEDESPINMTPMIDMVFLLLIFFLVATTFAQTEKEQGIQLPGTDSDLPLSATPRHLIINIAADGTPRVAGLEISQKELSALLERVARNEPDREVLIRADERSLMKYFADVADLCYKAGINEMKIGYLVRGLGPEQ